MVSFEDWTRVSWWILHVFASAFPDKPTEARRKSFESWMLGWAANFPCGNCGHHLYQYLKDNPIYPYTEKREKVEEYIYNLHESVNKRKGKPHMHTLEEVRQAFRMGLPWEGFGNYPILPLSKMSLLNSSLNPQERVSQTGKPSEHKKIDNELPKATTLCERESTFIWIIVFMSVVAVALGALCIYLAFRLRKISFTKSTSSKALKS